jgi:hypothetical protein
MLKCHNFYKSIFSRKSKEDEKKSKRLQSVPLDEQKPDLIDDENNRVLPTRP